MPISHTSSTDLDRPVSLGIRLASAISDDLQHAGQAAFHR
jgi:hypothetical protein